MSKEWKKFELNNDSIALKIFYVPHKTGKIHLAYKSKHNLTREKQVILLMITNGEKWHCTAVTRLSGLLRGVTGNNANHDYCLVEMPNEDNKIIKYNQGEKSIRSPFIIYADLECLLEKINTSYNNPEESSTTEINKHAPSVIHCLHIVHLIIQKINLIII